MSEAKQQTRYKCLCVAKTDDGKFVFKPDERDIPVPGYGQVVVRVLANGICHSDSIVKNGGYTFTINFPRVPGHEVIGEVVKVGEGAKRWAIGNRVGRGWHGAHCFSCPSCLQGDFITCAEHKITGLSDDGGYAEYMVAPWQSLAAVPPGLSSAHAAPLMCAGLTVFAGIRNAKLKPGAWVAVQGIGGLGHLAIQYANKMGYRVVAISSGASKKELTFQLGAHEYVDTAVVNAPKFLQTLGGVQLIVITGSSGKAASELLEGLGRNGQLLLLGVTHDAVPLNSISLIAKRLSVQGWPSGSPCDAEEAMAFAAQMGVKPMIETFRLEDGAQAYEKMMKNEVRFRAVIDFEKKEQ